MYKVKNNSTLFGFWLYLMTDLLVFAVLFATYGVLRNNTAGGPSGRELFNLPFVLTETLILLTSSFTMGIAVVFGKHKKRVLLFMGITMLLGLSFLGMELFEFNNLIREGDSFQNSAFLSSFFTLVGTHGLHILIGLLWMGVLMIYIMKRGLTPTNAGKVTLISLFWHFLDIVWIFIFTIVYLTGAL